MAIKKKKFTERQVSDEQNSPALVLSTSKMLLSHLGPFLDFFFLFGSAVNYFMAIKHCC